MKSNLKIAILITLGLVFAFLLLFANNLNFNTRISSTSSKDSDDFNCDNGKLKISAISGKIHIDNNWSAAEIAGICTGGGTYSDPYIIEDLVINGGGSGNCILIENSSEYFKIENCTVDNSDLGIQLSHVNNSRLIDNLCLNNNEYGIYLSYSNNNTISKNIGIDNYFGICLNYSESNSILRNNITTDEMYGIYLSHSNSNNISRNTAITHGWYGISFYKSNYNNLSENILSNNWMGILLQYSNSSIISGNTLITTFGEVGINLDYSDYNLIYRNKNGSNRAVESIWFGVTKHNTIYYNNFIKGTINHIHSLSNEWKSPGKIIYIYKGENYTNYFGNYWGDYTGTDADNDGIGDTPYTQNRIIDNYPLIEPIENYEIIEMLEPEQPETPIIPILPILPIIPGYNVFFLLGILSIVSITIGKFKK